MNFKWLFFSPHPHTSIPLSITILSTRWQLDRVTHIHLSDRCDWWGGTVVTATLSRVSEPVMSPWPASTLGAGTSAQNRRGNETFIVKRAVWNRRASQVQMTKILFTLCLNTPLALSEGILQKKSDGQMKTKGEEELRDPLIVPTGTVHIFLPVCVQFTSLPFNTSD